MEPTATEVTTSTTSALSIFDNADKFAHAQRVATALSKSDLVPQQFKNNLPNVLIALDMADRLRANPLAVMQSIYVVHGKPAWAATFIIAQINSCGKFSPLRYDIKGTGDSKGCVAWAKEQESGDRIEGPEVSIAMAKAEGWFDRQGSKWKTMPDVMLRYRAATFFGRLYCPELLMGMRTDDELGDVIDINTAPPIKTDKPQLVDDEPEEAIHSQLEPTAPVVLETLPPAARTIPADEIPVAQGPNTASPQAMLIEQLAALGVEHEIFTHYIHVNGWDKKNYGFEAKGPIESWPAEACMKIGSDTDLMSKAQKKFGKKA